VCGGVFQHSCECSDHATGSRCCHDKDCSGDDVCGDENRCVRPENLELGVDCTSSSQCLSRCCSIDLIGYKKCHDLDPSSDECKDDANIRR